MFYELLSIYHIFIIKVFEEKEKFLILTTCILLSSKKILVCKGALGYMSKGGLVIYHFTVLEFTTSKKETLKLFKLKITIQFSILVLCLRYLM